ncbi:unnamed protein product [Rhizoctonia solani]|uniref:Uncharacterized protein n=1 Tax=Rhizoctonia solani TaxID=456999 RepID=A0A8H3HPH2_9AGAM|nr:unnamed protein product [Rhizoctonia solani]
MPTFALHPVTPTEPVILRAFSRKYESRGTGSYLDEIHTWAQRARTTPVKWDVVQGTDDKFCAVPECSIASIARHFRHADLLAVPDVHGCEYRTCCGQGATQDLARQVATQHLQHYINGTQVEQVRWKFWQQDSPAGPIHCAVPVVYERPSFLQDDGIIGQGPSHQAAREDSARKLLMLGYCRI